MKISKKQSHAEWLNLAIPTDGKTAVEGERLSSGHERRRDKDYTTYNEYLCLNDLLSAQMPYTDVPDERVFISTHQKMELAFKDMLADIHLLDLTVNDLIDRVQSQGITGIPEFSGDGNDRYWTASLAAANRLKHIASRQLAAMFALLDYHKDIREVEEPYFKLGDSTFDSTEFARFRNSLVGASGFQSAQYRAIQHALGKSNLFKVKAIALWNAETDDWSLFSIDDPRAMEDELPESDALDDHILELLSIIAKCDKKNASSPETADFYTSLPDNSTICNDFRNNLNSIQSNVKTDVKERSLPQKRFDRFIEQRELLEDEFKDSLDQAINLEIDRRHKFEPAITGAGLLLDESSSIDKSRSVPLAHILRSIRVTDYALHGEPLYNEPQQSRDLKPLLRKRSESGEVLPSEISQNSFLAWHYPLITKRIGGVTKAIRKHNLPYQPKGTGGQGNTYLSFVFERLLGYFPALVPLKNLKPRIVKSAISYLDV